MIQTVDHIQIAIPPNGEERARAFYGKLLGLTEIPKPEPLAQRGGCWFETGGARLHLGVDARFMPAKKAHLAFQVSDLDELKARLEKLAGPLELDLSWPGYRRFYCQDPFGNRLEFLSRVL
jgi:catechol 2,3-dioxygenase-like lactoylglutathione lyase family enzyme